MSDLSTRYARALFELAIERGIAQDYMEQAGFISYIFKEADCVYMLAHPHISEADKLTFLNNSFAGQVYDDLLGFMHLAVKKNREKFIIPAMDCLVDMLRRHQNYIAAKVVSATPLTPQQERQLREKLARKLGKNVELSVEVDPDVIGGFRVHVDGIIFDKTVRRMLKDMTEITKKGSRHDIQA